MNRSFPIFTVKGTVVRLHVTFLLFVGWIGFTRYGRGGTQMAVDGVAFTLALFLCVLAHEFGHVFAARRYGIRTPTITLLPIGGVARLERMPQTPSHELVVALAGPAVNLAIAGIGFAIIAGVPSLASMALAPTALAFLAPLTVVNLFLALFNLIPAFPMDGGRVLRALLAYRLGPVRATRIAATVGKVLAVGLAAWGLTGHPMLVFIAGFVYLGAASEALAVQARGDGSASGASALLATDVERLSPLSRIADAARALSRTTRNELPVVDDEGRLCGVVTRDAVAVALRDRGPEPQVTDIMQVGIPLVPERAGPADALALLNGGFASIVGIVDADRRFLGLITRETLDGMRKGNARRPLLPDPWGGR